MPWHDVQFLKITWRTGPCGGVTCGRVARPDCAAAGEASAHTIAATITVYDTRSLSFLTRYTISSGCSRPVLVPIASISIP